MKEGMDTRWQNFACRCLRRNRLLFFSSLLATLFLMSIYLAYPGLRVYLENKVYDLLFVPASGAPGMPAPVIIDIDEKSLARYGQWPWPRYRIARLLEVIRAARPSAVGIDFLFAEPDRTSLKTIRNQMTREFGSALDLAGISPQLWDNDEILASAMAEGPFLLGYKFQFQPTDTGLEGCRLHPLNIAVGHIDPQDRSTPHLLQAAGLTCPLPQLAAQASGSGFINATPDSDGILRRLPLLIRYGDQFYPSLALATLCRAHGVTQARLYVQNGQIKALHAGQFEIPLDTTGNLLIRYYSRSPGFKHLSAESLLMGKVAAQELAGRIVFLGTSAVGLTDYRPTPVAAIFPGVAIHASVVANIQQGDLLVQPSWAPPLELGLILLSGLLTTVLLNSHRTLISSLLLAGWGLALWWGAERSLNRAGVFIAPLFPLLSLVINFSLLTLVKFVREEHRTRQRTRELVMAQEFTIQSLAALAETRDQETGGHIYRVQRYIRALCNPLRHTEKFRKFLDEDTIDLLYKSAPLHDIGKVGVPDAILMKSGQLTNEEYEEMQKHTTYGLRSLEKAEEHLDSRSSNRFLRFAKDMTYTHHERWDGKGYPRGLAGQDIPVAGRLMSLADVYDALVSRRIYKQAFSHEKAVAIISEGSGTLFDPDIVAAFIEVAEQFRQIATELSDESLGDSTASDR